MTRGGMMLKHLAVALMFGGVTVAAETKEYLFTEVECPACVCTCEEYGTVLERLDAVEARLGECLEPPAPVPVVESAPADTADEPVKEGLRQLQPLDTSVPGDGVDADLLLPGGGGGIQPASFASRHPVWTSIFVSAGTVALYAIIDDDDDGEDGQRGKAGAQGPKGEPGDDCHPPGQCR